MRLNLTDEQALLRDTARRFLEKEAPLSSVRAAHADPAGFSRETWRRQCELGWAMLAAPEDLGGFSASGNRGQDLAIVAEELGRLVGAGPFIPIAVALQALCDGPTAAARSELIGQVTAGSTMLAWAFGEAGGTWEPARFATTVRDDGDDVVVEGAKAYVEAGAEADLFLVTGRGSQGPVQVLIPADAPGVSMTRCGGADFVRRFAEVRLDGVRLPRAAVVTDGPEAAARIERQVQLALLLQCAETNGALERAFEFTVDYMRQRYAFGRPIASFQALKHRLADMLLAIQSAMATTDAALEAFDAGSGDAARLARIAKAYVSQQGAVAISDLVQMTGGIAVTWEHDLHLYERRIALNRALLGTPERHRADLHALIAA